MTPVTDERTRLKGIGAETGTDFFYSQFGNYAGLPFWRQRRMGRFVDPIFDLRLNFNGSFRAIPRKAAEQKSLDVLVLGVDVPARSADLTRVLNSLTSSHHRVTLGRVPLLDGRGKFQNINQALKSYQLDRFHWLIVTDDDIKVPQHFLDHFLYLAELQELKICMPAHRFHSYMGYAITQRHWNSLVRVTHFAECGPLTAFRREVFPFCLPFSETRWAWGIDVLWSEQARARNCRVGIVDACSVNHLRPIGGSYNGKAAREEAELFLESQGAQHQRSEILKTVSIMRTLPR
jgi:hypothetical protein